LTDSNLYLEQKAEGGDHTKRRDEGTTETAELFSAQNVQYTACWQRLREKFILFNGALSKAGCPNVQGDIRRKMHRCREHACIFRIIPYNSQEGSFKLREMGLIHRVAATRRESGG